ncbi:hypothetical protein [uncultured Gammaproteobacteria bacterium]|nr:hypothetical protein [uncultured Gammaproteobacteria bacterium]
MVFLTAILRTSLLLISPLSLGIIADDNTQNSINIVDELESINYEILDLEVSYDLGENLYDINLEVDNLKNELLFREYQIGTPKGGDSDWNESEQLILDAKIKLLALQEKIKLEGD